MGKGNCLVCSDVGGQWYIDNGDLYVYRSKETDDVVTLREIPYNELDEYEFDDHETLVFCNEIIDELKASLKRRFPCFEDQDEWLRGNSGRNERQAILENKLFWIAIEDNEWCLAVELVPKDEPWGLHWMENLQKKHYHTYLDGIRDALFEQFEHISYRTGAWTSGTLRRWREAV